MVTCILTPDGVPTGPGVKFYLLKVAFYQLVNDVMYSLKNGSYNSLKVIQAIQLTTPPMPGLFVNAYVGSVLQQILDNLNLEQVVNYTPFDESTEEQEVLGVDITINYLPKN